MADLVEASDQGTTALCTDLITPERMVDLLRLIADTPAPSGVSSLTRGHAVRAWLEAEGLADQGVRLELDARRSGCDVLQFGTGGVRMLAHLDEISYLAAGHEGQRGPWQVAPYCYHLAEDAAPARALRFSSDGSWEVVSQGQVLRRNESLYYDSNGASDLAPGDRVALASPLSYEASSGLVTGSLDNAAGVAAAMLAGEVLARAQIPFEVVMTDEEEGPSGASSQTISRGATRYFHEAYDAPLNIVIDIHGLPEDEPDDVQSHVIPWGASLAEFSSHGRGSVAPPQLYAGAVELLSSSSVPQNVRQNRGGYVPRSDDVVAMTRSNRVLILGYPGSNRHFDRGLPTANVHDLVDLARALVVLAAGVAGRTLAVDW